MNCARRGIRVSVIEPAYTKTPFDANFLEPDATLEEYREVRAAVNKRVKEVMATADEPRVVAERRAEGGERGAPQSPIHGRSSRGPPATPSHVSARWPDGRRDSKRLEARRPHPRVLTAEQ